VNFVDFAGNVAVVAAAIAAVGAVAALRPSRWVWRQLFGAPIRAWATDVATAAARDVLNDTLDDLDGRVWEILDDAFPGGPRHLERRVVRLERHSDLPDLARDRSGADPPGV